MLQVEERKGIVIKIIRNSGQVIHCKEEKVKETISFTFFKTKAITPACVTFLPQLLQHSIP